MNASKIHARPSMKDTTVPTAGPAEQAFLVGIKLRKENRIFCVEDSLAELALLCNTAGVRVVGHTTQTLELPRPDTFIGRGKLEEIIAWQRELSYDVLVVDEELQPRQQRELEEAVGVKVIDRTALILDIFAQHARTREGQLQVELAQYEYRLPRLTRMWTHLARQAGGGGGRSGVGVGLRGPGETQLEIDRREIRTRIRHVKRELEQVRAHRHHYRQKRESAGMPVVAIVGYTNAGKSTLLNALAHSHILVGNKLFATLDPTTRRVTLPSGHPVLFTDTVGFIQKLPPQLTAAFRATLEEIGEADILLSMLDATQTNLAGHHQTVQSVLADLGVNGKLTLTVLNKIDIFDGDRSALQEQFPDALLISAATGEGLEDLMAEIEVAVEEEWLSVTVNLPFDGLRQY